MKQHVEIDELRAISSSTNLFEILQNSNCDMLDLAGTKNQLRRRNTTKKEDMPRPHIENTEKGRRY